ncbi:MAG: hypothetical protein NUV32_02965 [Exilispira sp.]|jgi:DNA mismatch repair ATPase MutS|nr:hypothetical protein [Exilispira sp.]
MAFNSILFKEKDQKVFLNDNFMYNDKEPEFFNDLNLDYFIEELVKHKEKYNLKEFFYRPLCDKETIIFRQEIMKDLEVNDELFKKIKDFAHIIFDAVKNVEMVIKYLKETEEKHKNYLEKGRFLNSFIVYHENIKNFEELFHKFNLKSEGLTEFKSFLSNYVRSKNFADLLSEAKTLHEELTKLKYCMLIKDNCIKVRKYENEEDYTIEVEKIFEKFRDQETKDYRKTFTEEPFAEHVEVAVLNLVAKLYPKTFIKLDEFYENNKYFVQEILARFSREIQFYISYLEYIKKLKDFGLNFSYPEIVTDTKEIYGYECFDIVLASKLINQEKIIITNDFYLKKEERIIVVSGPNQGGKTTFAKMFGQLHFLASLGFPIPSRKARLFLYDKILTHFEREEKVQSLQGKLQSDLVRMKKIIDNSTQNSIIIINEFLSSTALKDAISIGKKIMDTLIKKDVLGIWVTFLDELSSYSEKIVSMVSTVDPNNPVKRTFKIIRKPADGLAYAMHIAQQYGLTYEILKEKIIS